MRRATACRYARSSSSPTGSATKNTASEPLLATGDWQRVWRAAVAQCTDDSALSPSVIPTRHFQRSLPRLPVPMLSRTMLKCAAAVKPFVPPTQYEKTVKALKEFEAKDGARLQEELIRVDKANQHTSYISSDWFERVLREREPLPMRRSRTLLVRSPSPGLDMLSRATIWVRSSVLFYKAYLDNTLYPSVRYVPDDARAYYQQDWFERTIALCPEYVSCTFMTVASGNHAFPLDLSQYDNLFNSTRAPGVLQDEVRAVGFMPHIVVQHRGRQFAVTVADADGNPLPEDQIYARLRAVVRASPSSGSGSTAAVDVSVFTALPRTEWSGVRTALMRQADNHASLQTLDSSIFVLHLDDDVDVDGYFDDPNTALRRATATVGGRWWDKSMCVRVTSRGDVFVGYEESWGDGGAVRRYVEDVYQHSMRRLSGGAEVVDHSVATEAPKELQWTLTPALETAAAAARRSAQRDVDRLDSGAGVITGMAGRAICSVKNNAFASGSSSSFRSASFVNTADTGASSTSTAAGAAAINNTGAVTHLTTEVVVQLALQLAWWRLNTGSACCAQPVTMGAFRRGRLDLLYGATTESQAFVRAVASSSSGGSSSSANIKELCRKALGAHEVTAKEVHAGAGIYAHLLGLRNVAQRMYGRTPALFSDPSIRMLLQPQLMVVPESAPSLLAATATPVAGGYGVTYTTIEGGCDSSAANDSLVLHVSSWKGGEDSPRYSSGEFAQGVLEAIADIHRLMRS